jgi:hypothetical protein
MFTPRSLSFLLATYNERETILPLIERILTTLTPVLPLEIIVVDDNSPDGTAALVENIGDPRIKVIKRTRARGLASAYHRGLLESSGDVLAWMDADGCMPVALVPEMIARLADNDAVVGSRFVAGGADQRSPLRVYASKLITGFARLLLRCQTRDLDSGFIVMRRECLEIPLFSPSGYGEYFIEMIANLEKHHYRILELGYAFRDRAVGEGASKSFHGLLKFLRLGAQYGWRVLRVALFPLAKPLPAPQKPPTATAASGAAYLPAGSNAAEIVAPDGAAAVEKIMQEGTIYAIIVRQQIPALGIHFFTPNIFSQQVALMRHPAGYRIKAHLHNLIVREVKYTREVLWVTEGRVRADFYDNDQKFLASRELGVNDLLILCDGGHGFEMLQTTTMCEVKQGPYIGAEDKTLFEPAPPSSTATGAASPRA